ncbi:hypothetical protein L3X38_032611 [Prunus dulcis]|uniref:Uncharacterized protein n=1 Tax=Prunus dulcis TaxID=3755 RepID=A0AAD4VFS7_PRUDU|nr:hypothetical protein L3X38_032611 [Prunus dulcis]
MKRTRKDTTDASSPRLNRECPIASMRRHKASRLALQKDQPQHGPADHSEYTIEVEDIAAIHNTNVEVDAKPMRHLE